MHTRQKKLAHLGFLISSVLILSSCSTLWPARPAKEAKGEESVYHDNYIHYRGAIHVHTSYSKDTKAPFSELRAALKKLRIDYAIITDQDTRQGHELLEGMHDRTLWLFGNEVSTEKGQYLALHSPLTFPIDREAEVVMDMVYNTGGLGFIAHPFGEKDPWLDWNVRYFNGMEIYNASDDFHDESKVGTGLKWLIFPRNWFSGSTFDRPVRELAKWDELTQKKRVVGIGGNDARANLRLGKTSLANYGFMLGRVSTYVLANALAPEEIYKGLFEGHAYVAFEEHGDARDFIFHGINGEEYVVMGDEMRLTESAEVRIWSPRKATLVLLKDGQAVRSEVGQEMREKITAPGVYRVEVSLGKKLWIISNPIYVREM